ncbi:MerR family transcriptional regulator [Turneriella parva]|uniref:Transcriptional regulator, MerR family n=1 Tax=Turneriella parva (strain ATCC BAA-1111 / DSM 21527 / NCTC 11395 / H) TaxID=869212 RepID=I4BA04_TURPD|nr:MerR family transcriptional regulator [Turneriella parva]AFM14111.1 transcriptional regulator, MerR family [Turneriella parva DSM 21527]
MTTGKLAEKFKINREAIRFYERKGLLPKPERTATGYRLYDVRAEKTLSFILNSKKLGFTLAEIKSLLSLRIVNGENCSTIRIKAQRKIEDIENKIHQLGSLKRALSLLVESCLKKQTSTYCPIIDNLEN